MTCDGMTVWEIFEDIRFVKMTPKEYEKIDLLKSRFQESGSLSLTDTKSLRNIWKAHVSRIKAVREARERARVSLSIEKLGKPVDRKGDLGI